MFNGLVGALTAEGAALDGWPLPRVGTTHTCLLSLDGTFALPPAPGGHPRARGVQGRRRALGRGAAARARGEAGAWSHALRPGWAGLGASAPLACSTPPWRSPQPAWPTLTRRATHPIRLPCRPARRPFTRASRPPRAASCAWRSPRCRCGTIGARWGPLPLCQCSAAAFQAACAARGSGEPRLPPLRLWLAAGVNRHPLLAAPLLPSTSPATPCLLRPCSHPPDAQHTGGEQRRAAGLHG